MNGAERSHSIEEWLHVVDISNPACQGKCDRVPFGDGLNCSGNTDPGGLHFTGKEHDVESGLDYFNARYYDENVGR
ncbi:MAG TPA: hypothetical protein VHX11_06655 [Acidobacteriaceae bacterium]|jgi:hypothetical protein|nr:hypothetical protein [Acidobacteriaceae bacterium]